MMMCARTVLAGKKSVFCHLVTLEFLDALNVQEVCTYNDRQSTPFINIRIAHYACVSSLVVSLYCLINQNCNTLFSSVTSMQMLLNAGNRLLSSPKKLPQSSIEEEKQSEDDFGFDTIYRAPSALPDNMSILRDAMEQTNSTTITSTSPPLSEASRYRIFCAESGIKGSTSDFIVWRDTHSSHRISEETPPPIPPYSSTSSTADNLGRLQLLRLVRAGILDSEFLHGKLSSNFNKTLLIDDTEYYIKIGIRYTAGRGALSSPTVWAILTANGITPPMCDKLMRAAYDAAALQYPDLERPYFALVKTFEVTMQRRVVKHLRLLMLGVQEVDETKGFGASHRLNAFLYVFHRLVGDALRTAVPTNSTFLDLIEGELVNQLLTTEYYEQSSATRLRVKDRAHESEMAALRDRFDAFTRAKPSGPTNSLDVSPSPSRAKLPMVCLPYARHPSLCVDASCEKLHSWPPGFPLDVKQRLLERISRIPLPTTVADAGHTPAASRLSSRTSRHGSVSPSGSMASSISGDESS
jgi:hypothetical protein